MVNGSEDGNSEGERNGGCLRWGEDLSVGEMEREKGGLSDFFGGDDDVFDKVDERRRLDWIFTFCVQV